MKKLMICLLLSGFAFGQQIPAVRALRVEAAKRHIRWQIFCTPFQVPSLGIEKFSGWAVPPGDDFKVYLEEGGKPDWMVYGPTQAVVASRLLDAIKKPPNALPLHTPATEKHEMCPKTISSEE